MKLTFKTPVQKKNKCYISYPDEKINLDFNEIKIKNIEKNANNQNYILSCYIPANLNKNNIKKIIKIDNDVNQTILNNNNNWFNNNLNIDEIDKLYAKSYDNDTDTINLLLPINMPVNIIINNVNSDNDKLFNILNDTKNFKKYIINIEISLLGIYFYPKISSNKWIIKTINITNIEETNIENLWNRKDIEDDWETDIQEINYDIDNKIKSLTDIKEKINKTFNNIKDIENPDNLWENKIELLKSLILKYNNILSIYDNR
jgi:hypothetical protein